MAYVQNDLDKRILAEFARQNASYRRALTTDVIDDIATLWIASGGDAGGFDEEVGKIRQRINEMEKGS